MAELHNSAELHDGLYDHVLPYKKFARWVQMFKRGRVSTAVQHEVAQDHKPNHANSVRCPPNHWQQTVDNLSNYPEG